jgi:hypothetical protein
MGVKTSGSASLADEAAEKQARNRSAPEIAAA